MRLDTTRTALIVVDAQVGFVTEHSEPALPNMVRLLEGWADAYGLAVLTRFVNAPGSPYVRLIGWAEMMPGDPAVELHPAIAPVPGSAWVVDKTGYSALTSEVLGLLRNGGITDVVVAGLDTESCVLATALGAFETGLTPWLVTDASASHAGPAEHAAGLLVARRYIGRGQLVTTDQVLASIQAATPQRAAG